jgi:uncharacterized OB-fold protein
VSLPPKPRPQADRDSAPYWAAAREGRLSLQRCAACGTFRWPARAMCNRCYAFDSAWTDMSGRGTVISWVVNHQVFSAAFKDETPYVVVNVRLEEQDDLRLVGRFLGEGEPWPGQELEAVFTPAGEETLINWRPRRAASGAGETS